MRNLFITPLMRRVLWFFIVILGSCSFFQENSQEKTRETNLISLESKGQTVLLGTQATGEQSWVRFDYNFELGEKEITIKEFENLMGYLPSSLSLDLDENLPVTFVNLYDAVRFCNRLSRQSNLDTVYQYLGVKTDANGQTLELEGLTADLTKNGYRLPTESEWLFAARGNSEAQFAWGSDSLPEVANQYAWTSLNSEGKAHPVGTKKATSFGFFDLTGNAQEIVWGRWGLLPADTVINYIGPTDISGQPLVIVKGGSFSHSLSVAKNAMRKDVYSVFSTTRLAYLGFRVAKGAIARPTFSDGSGGFVNSTPFRVVATREEVMTFFRTNHVKLAFVNATNGALASVDFAPIGFSSKEFLQGVDVANPVFSPDGEHLAFATRYEGQSGKSQGYVVRFPGDSTPRLFTENSAYRPRWWVDPKDKNWWIVVGDSGIANSEKERWEKGTTRAIAWQNAPDRILSTQGSFHSGISTDERYLVSGYTRLVRFDTQSGETKDLFLSPENGKDAEGSTQACNVSLRPSPNSEVLFLDFGYPRQSTITSGSYGIHEYIFSANIQSGEIEKYFQVPAQYSAWGYSLWSNHPDYFVAAVTDGSDVHKAVYAVRYSDGSMLKLIEGIDLIMPSLWVDSLAWDMNWGDWEDLGRYGIPAGNQATIWNGKMVPYWSTYGERDSYIFGTSREWAGIDPSLITDYKFLNMAGPLLGAYAGMEWAQYYLWNRPTLPRTILLGIGPEFSGNFTLEWFRISMGKSLGFLKDKENNFWADSLPSLAKEILIENGKQGFNYEAYAPDSLGYHTVPGCEGWGEPLLTIDDTWENGPADWMKGWEYLKSFVKEATDKGIRVATVIMPMNPRYQETPFYTRHGGLRTEVLAFLDSVKSLENGNPDFRHFDFHHDGKHDFKDTEAADSDHLCRVGAIRVTDSLRQALKQWDSE